MYSKEQVTIESLRAANKYLEEIIVEKEKRIENLEDRLFSGEDCDSLEEWKLKAEKQLKYYIEIMAAAFCKENDLPPSKIMLKVTASDDGKSLFYWMEKNIPEKYAETICIK